MQGFLFTCYVEVVVSEETSPVKRKVVIRRKPIEAVAELPKPVKKLNKKELYKEFNDLLLSIRYGVPKIN